jgi:inner membrane protein
MLRVGVCLFVANLPDLDFILQIITGERYHRGFTHSLVFAIAAALLCAVLFRGFWGWGVRRLWLLFVSLTVSHLLLDLLTTGGQGIPLLWPFSKDLYRAPFALFPETHHSKGLYLQGQLVFVLFETAYAALLLAVIKGWGRRGAFSGALHKPAR